MKWEWRWESRREPPAMPYLPKAAAREVYRRYGLRCPWCGLRARSLASLVCHMRFKHPKELYDLASQCVRDPRWWRRR